MGNANSSGPYPSPGSNPQLNSSGAGAPMVPPAPLSQPGLPAAPMVGQRLVVRLPQVGTKLVSKRGDYEVRRVLGTGEFGAVYDCLG
ncbi:MAG TPA: hypothetical protein VGH87_21000, partial [Polyangiaceae bacterium]